VIRESGFGTSWNVIKKWSCRNMALWSCSGFIEKLWVHTNHTKPMVWRPVKIWL
jgi:hypothetical protein